MVDTTSPLAPEHFRRQIPAFDPIEVVNAEGVEAVLLAESWIPLIDEPTKSVSLPLMSYINGTEPDIEQE